MTIEWFYDVMRSNKDVSGMSNLSEQKEGGVVRHVGVMDIGILNATYSIITSKAFVLISLGVSFQYNLDKIYSKKILNDAMDNFNKTKVGLKAVKDSRSNDRKIIVNFSSELICPISKDSIKEYLEPMLNLLVLSPQLFSLDLELLGVSHRSIIKNK